MTREIDERFQARSRSYLSVVRHRQNDQEDNEKDDEYQYAASCCFMDILLVILFLWTSIADGANQERMLIFAIDLS